LPRVTCESDGNGAKVQGLALHFESGAGEAICLPLKQFVAVTSIVQLFSPVREEPMDLKSLKRRPPRQTDILEAPFFCHIDNYAHYHYRTYSKS
jgi:hypothetical protein